MSAARALFWIGVVAFVIGAGLTAWVLIVASAPVPDVGRALELTATAGWAPVGFGLAVALWVIAWTARRSRTLRIASHEPR